MERVLAVIVVLALAGGAASAQDAAGSGGDERLLSCIVDDSIPDAPAVADQGGFGFEYQSFRGVTEDERACTVYRLRNTVGKPPTPFRWTLADDVVVDKARLGRCGPGADACPWATFVKYFAGQVDTNLSTLSYGLNADAFHEQAETYLSHASVPSSSIAEESGTIASSVGTEINGRFETDEGVAVDVHLLVKSRFEPAPGGGSTLVYEIEDLGGSGALGAGAVRADWEALDAIEPVAALLQRADGAGRGTLAVEGVGTVERTPHALAVAIPAGAFVLDTSFSFHVLAGDASDPLVTVDMAAYVPVQDAR